MTTRDHDAALLEVDQLTITAGATEIVSGASFRVARGETLALVGESGCGKTVTAYALLRLLDAPLAITGGRVRLGGVDLLSLSERELERVRGKRAAIIFQEPMTALNPVLTVGEQVAEALVLHERMNGARARERAADLFKDVGIPDPKRRLDDYPHRLSGGMRQRVVIAMALACNPELLIADEPTTALDVTVQAQILELLRRLQAERKMGMLLITHDLGVVAETAHRVAVMYAGRIVEEAAVGALFARPSHPYTRGLLAARPATWTGSGPWGAIKGSVPAPRDYPPGCRFHPRCPEKRDECVRAVPALNEIAAQQRVACFARAEVAR